MWIVSTNGFISLVQDRKNKDVLHVRARVADDISAHFPDATIQVFHGADYRYRALISREEVAAKMFDMINEMAYTSHFKDVALKTAPKNGSRHTAYYGTWNAMANMQDYAPYSKVPRPTRPTPAVTRPFSGWSDDWVPRREDVSGGREEVITDSELALFSEEEQQAVAENYHKDVTALTFREMEDYVESLISSGKLKQPDDTDWDAIDWDALPEEEDDVPYYKPQPKKKKSKKKWWSRA